MAVLFYDTFTGGGNLLGHTSGSGHTYIDVSGASGLLLDGAGALYTSLNDYRAARPSPQVDVPEFYTLTVAFELTGTPSTTGYTEFHLNAADGSRTYVGVGKDAGVNYLSWRGNDGAVSAQEPLVLGVHTLVIERMANGNTRGGVDGVTVEWPSLPNRTGETAARFSFYFDGSGGGAQLMRIRSVELTSTVVPPPDPFWTAFVGTRETLI